LGEADKAHDEAGGAGPHAKAPAPQSGHRDASRISHLVIAPE